MPPAHGRSSALTRAIRRARWRLVAGRLTDALSTSGLLMAGLIGGALIAETQGITGSTPWLLSIAILGSAAILARALGRLPTDLAAAIDLDHRNRLSELLSTAWITNPASPHDRAGHASVDTWSVQVQRQAEAACGGLTQPPRTGRFSPRAHAATLVALAAVIAGWMLVHSPITRAPSSSMAMGDRASSSTVSPNAGLSAGFRTPGEAETQMQLPGAPQTTAAEGSSGKPGSDNQPSGAGNDARGAGRAESQAPSSPPKAFDASAANTPNQRPSGSISAGGNGTPALATTDGAAGGHVNIEARSQAAPWSDAGWNASRETARSQLDNGQIPDAYRPLVKAYFDR